jgi:hypothetical protein
VQPDLVYFHLYGSERILAKQFPEAHDLDMNPSPFLSLRGVSKSFRAVKASDQIDVAGAGAAENEAVALTFAEEIREAPGA